MKKVIAVVVVVAFVAVIWMARQDSTPASQPEAPNYEVRAEIAKNKAKDDCRKIRAMKRDGAFSDASGVGREMITDALVKCDASGFTEQI